MNKKLNFKKGTTLNLILKKNKMTFTKTKKRIIGVICLIVILKKLMDYK
jgi:hypothetical protein